MFVLKTSGIFNALDVKNEKNMILKADFFIPVDEYCLNKLMKNRDIRKYILKGCK